MYELHYRCSEIYNIKMNYQRIYDSIIQGAKSKNRKRINKTNVNYVNYVYYEKHHIIPRCIGGEDNEENLI